VPESRRLDWSPPQPCLGCGRPVSLRKTSRDRFRSIELIAAYGYGRPTQPISGDAEPEPAPLRVTVVFDKPEADAAVATN